MGDTLKNLNAQFKAKQYKDGWRPSGTDASLVGLTTGGAAFASWIIELTCGVPVPPAVAGFLGAILGLAVARIFKP